MIAADDKPCTSVEVLSLQLLGGARLSISLDAGRVLYDLVTADGVRHPIKAQDVAALAALMR